MVGFEGGEAVGQVQRRVPGKGTAPAEALIRGTGGGKGGRQ